MRGELCSSSHGTLSLCWLMWPVTHKVASPLRTGPCAVIHSASKIGHLQKVCCTELRPLTVRALSANLFVSPKFPDLRFVLLFPGYSMIPFSFPLGYSLPGDVMPSLLLFSIWVW